MFDRVLNTPLFQLNKSNSLQFARESKDRCPSSGLSGHIVGFDTGHEDLLRMWFRYLKKEHTELFFVKKGLENCYILCLFECVSVLV